MYSFTSAVFLLVPIFLFTLYLYLTRHFNYWERKGVKINGRPYPLVGNLYKMLLFKKCIGEFVKDIYDNYKDESCVGLYLMDKPALLIRDPQLVKSILIENFHKFENRAVKVNAKYDHIMGNVLLFMERENWKNARPKMTPAFTSVKLKGMFHLIKQIGTYLNQYMTEVLAKADSTDAKDLSVKYATEAMGTCVFGISVDCFQDEDSYIFKVGKSITHSNFFIILKQSLFLISPRLIELLRLKLFNSFLYDKMESVFWSIYHERKNNEIFRGDVIDLFLELDRNEVLQTGKHLEKSWLIGQAATFYLGGFEPTSALISFALYELCLNIEIQNKLRTEIHKHFKALDDVTYESIHSLKYLNMVLSETQRKYPTFNFLDRECVEEFKIPDTGVIIEKGTPILISTFGLHYDSNLYPNPDKFDPERFNDENIGTIETGAYVPFGLGPRNCIGERFGLLIVKLGLIQMLFDFEVVSTPETPVPMKFNPKLILIQAKGGLSMKFRKIST